MDFAEETHEHEVRLVTHTHSKPIQNYYRPGQELTFKGRYVSGFELIYENESFLRSKGGKKQKK